MTCHTLLAHVKVQKWLDFFDCMLMWVAEYTHLQMIREAGVGHACVEQWIQTFQDAAVRHVAEHKSILFREKKKPTRIAMRRPGGKGISKRRRHRGCVRKKPSMTKKPRTSRLIIQIDESHLNKHKPSRLAKVARPSKDHVWVWGATVQGRPDLTFFKILEHPKDALEGRPRGKNEILKILHSLGIPSGAILASDEWAGTLAAVKQFKKDKGWSDRQLRHESINHSKQLVNEKRFTTNAIEARWSVMKRWAKKLMGGKMPSYSDRAAWKRLLAEFEFRQIWSTYTMDWGKTVMMSFSDYLAVLAIEWPLI